MGRGACGPVAALDLARKGRGGRAGEEGLAFAKCFAYIISSLITKSL